MKYEFIDQNGRVASQAYGFATGFWGDYAIAGGTDGVQIVDTNFTPVVSNIFAQAFPISRDYFWASRESEGEGAIFSFQPFRELRQLVTPVFSSRSSNLPNSQFGFFIQVRSGLDGGEDYGIHKIATGETSWVNGVRLSPVSAHFCLSSNQDTLYRIDGRAVFLGKNVERIIPPNDSVGMLHLASGKKLAYRLNGPNVEMISPVYAAGLCRDYSEGFFTYSGHNVAGFLDIGGNLFSVKGAVDVGPLNNSKSIITLASQKKVLFSFFSSTRIGEEFDKLKWLGDDFLFGCRREHKGIWKIVGDRLVLVRELPTRIYNVDEFRSGFALVSSRPPE